MEKKKREMVKKGKWNFYFSGVLLLFTSLVKCFSLTQLDYDYDVDGWEEECWIIEMCKAKNAFSSILSKSIEKSFYTKEKERERG